MRKIHMISSTGSGSFALLSIYGNLVLVCCVAAVLYDAYQFLHTSCRRDEQDTISD
jgi:hypothetical protein